MQIWEENTLSILWKKTTTILFISLLALGIPRGGYADNSMVCVVSEHKMAFSYPPVLSDVTVAPFADGNLLMIYEADIPDTAVIGEQMGVGNMMEQRLEIFDPPTPRL